MDRKILPFGPQRAPGDDGIAICDCFRDRFRRQPVTRGARRGVEQIDRLWHDPDARNLADAFDLLQVVLEGFRRVRQRAVTIAGRRHLSDLRQRIFIAHEQNRDAKIGMIFLVGAGHVADEIGNEPL